MLQLYIAAMITSVVTVCMFGALVRQLTVPGHRWKLLCLAFLGLFTSPLAYALIRLPMIRLIEPPLFGTTPEKPDGTASAFMRGSVRLLYAPLTEEPMKLLPWVAMLLIGVMHKPTREMVVPIALTVGVAFAIGEFWLVAYLISAKPDPALAQLPWYAFGGYMSERLMTCFSHTLFALPTVLLYRRGVLLAMVGLAIGMVLHYLGNAPIVLMNHRAFGISTESWSVIVSLWLAFFVLIATAAMVTVHFGREVIARIIQNKMICPECGAIYLQPILAGINMGTWRYEPCGACHKWHWVTIKDLAPLEKADAP